MNLSQYDIELIEKNIEGSLTEDERKEFLQRENESEEFREAAIFQRKLLSTLEASEKSKLKQQLIRQFQTPSKNKTRKLQANRKLWYAIAASVILVVSSIFIIKNSSIDKDDLYDKFYEPYPNILAARSMAYDSIGLSLYSQGRYLKAIDNLKQHLPANDTIHFYLGLCHMSINEYEQALLYLDKIHESSIFIPQKKWYKGLAQMELGQVDSAKITFKEIRELEFKYEEAQVILNTLE